MVHHRWPPRTSSRAGRMISCLSTSTSPPAIGSTCHRRLLHWKEDCTFRPATSIVEVQQSAWTSRPGLHPSIHPRRPSNRRAPSPVLKYLATSRSHPDQIHIPHLDLAPSIFGSPTLALNSFGSAWIEEPLSDRPVRFPSICWS